MATQQMDRLRRLKRCFLWICRTAGCLVLAAAGLAAASPVALVLLFLLAVLLSSVFLWVGVLAGLAAIAACILHYLVGLPFWFWMIFTGFGVVLFGVGLLGSLFSSGDGSNGECETPEPRNTIVPWLWLLVGLLIGGWWGEHNGG